MSKDIKKVFTTVEKTPSIDHDEAVDVFVFAPAAIQRIEEIPGESFDDPLLGLLPSGPARLKIGDIAGESFDDPLLGFDAEAIWGTNGASIIDDLG